MENFKLQNMPLEDSNNNLIYQKCLLETALDQNFMQYILVIVELIRIHDMDSILFMIWIVN